MKKRQRRPHDHDHDDDDDPTNKMVVKKKKKKHNVKDDEDDKVQAATDDNDNPSALSKKKTKRRRCATTTSSSLKEEKNSDVVVLEKNDDSNDRRDVNKKKPQQKPDEQSSSSSSSATTTTTTPSDNDYKKQRLVACHEFDTNVLDHCETPKVAYEHLNDFLEILAKRSNNSNLKKTTHQQLRIWDPYYCDGSMKRIFEDELGYTNIIHENVDFYELIKEKNKIPDHDVLVTNPPYSDDHIHRLLDFCITTELPNQIVVCLLLPNYVSRQVDYIERFVKPNEAQMNELLYLGPIQPYIYTMPTWLSKEDRPSHVGENGQTTPYLSSWYIVVPRKKYQNIDDNDNNTKTTSFLDIMDALSKSQQNQQQRKQGWVVAKTVKGLKWKINKLIGKNTKNYNKMKKKKRRG